MCSLFLDNLSFEYCKKATKLFPKRAPIFFMYKDKNINNVLNVLKKDSAMFEIPHIKKRHYTASVFMGQRWTANISET